MSTILFCDIILQQPASWRISVLPERKGWGVQVTWMAWMTQVHGAEKTCHGSTSPLTTDFWLCAEEATGANEFCWTFVGRQVLFCNDGDQNKFTLIHATEQGWRLAKWTHWTGMGAQFYNSLACQDMLGLTRGSPASFWRSGSVTSVFIVSFCWVWGFLNKSKPTGIDKLWELQKSCWFKHLWYQVTHISL